jgi:ribonuclease P protein component
MPGARLTFSKDKRLIRSVDFARVRDEGQVHRGSLLVLAVRAAPESAVFRAGFITAKQIGNAVLRNRVRRRLREIVRKRQNQIKRGFWLVTIARGGAAKATYRALEDEWLRLAKRAFILAP